MHSNPAEPAQRCLDSLNVREHVATQIVTALARHLQGPTVEDLTHYTPGGSPVPPQPPGAPELLSAS